MSLDRGERPRWVRTVLARVAVAVVAGLLVVGAVALGRDTPPVAAAQEVPEGGVSVGAITVYDAYVREPATDDAAAAYFTIRNGGTEADTLVSVDSGAALTVGLHDLPGSEGHQESGPLQIPAGQTVQLSPGEGHVMLEEPVSPILPGQIISLQLRFAGAGSVLVSAPVIAIGVEPPGGRP